MPFQFVRIEPHITLCCHRGPVTLEDSRQLRAFLKTVDGNLLVDLRHSPSWDMAQEFCRVRSMLPKTAFVGPELPRVLCADLPGKDYIKHEVRHFTTEEEALEWLREGQEQPIPVSVDAFFCLEV
ncbi:MAG TPA: STAS/SEC14 domain-containing protein [Aggregatilineaceae bacterium]|jgi:hypothetical protein|nr:STAS/SEC14 domain-containing protein [Aggregatilineaceae bacterium]